jgi:hypothetical protein
MFLLTHIADISVNQQNGLISAAVQSLMHAKRVHICLHNLHECSGVPAGTVF